MTSTVELISPRNKQSAFHLATTIIIIATIVGLIVWDIVTISEAGPDTTISRITLRFTRTHPSIPLAIGALVGHLFWGTNTEKSHTRELILLILGLGGLLTMDLTHSLPMMEPLWPFLMGIPIGHSLFGQPIPPAVRAARSIAG